MKIYRRYLSTGYIWDNIRVLGGAYGGSAGFSHQSGRIFFSSYRDPNILETLKCYNEAAIAFDDNYLNQNAIDETIIGCIGGIN